MGTQVRAKLKNLELIPADGDSEGSWYRMFIGPDGSDGEESFDLLVCTPQWLAVDVELNGPRVGNNLVIVEAMDSQRVEAFLRKQVESIMRPTWAEAAAELSRFAHWEFDGYSPSSPKRPIT